MAIIVGFFKELEFDHVAVVAVGVGDGTNS